MWGGSPFIAKGCPPLVAQVGSALFSLLRVCVHKPTHRSTRKAVHSRTCRLSCLLCLCALSIYAHVYVVSMPARTQDREQYPPHSTLGNLFVTLGAGRCTWVALRRVS